jgi:membrane protein implicated in regulation of membrane protease activity
MELWIIFLIIGGLLVTFEMFSGSFVLLPIGASFFISGLYAKTNQDTSKVFIVLMVSAITLVMLSRYWIKKRKTVDTPSGMDAMIGKKYKIHTGEIQLYSDRFRAVFENGETPTDGTEVTVVKVDGNKLIVKK